MTDIYTTKERSAIMRKVRSTRTSIEDLVAATLQQKTRTRIDRNRCDLPGSPDITIRRYSAAVMVNGCFWHGHQCLRGNRIPKTNQSYWEAKIARNRRRDRRVERELRACGWHVYTVWECQLGARKIDTTLSHLISQMRWRSRTPRD